MDRALLETRHRILIGDSRDMGQVASGSVDLAITSPPYPMIQMWDQLFCSMNPQIKRALERREGSLCFELMHRELDKVWDELYRALKPGSFACINIGDATRTVGTNFQLYPNHSRIISHFHKIGFHTLPAILWRKQANTPNKFMGSGMLPSGAYVTLEHEYILIFRKGPKREFRSQSEQLKRKESSFFWEERNSWFSDIWDFKGIAQNLDHKALRERSAAYPLELAYRLTNMYSLYGDLILDPFVGTGTTMLAGIASGRNTIGVDIDKEFAALIADRITGFLTKAKQITADRIKRHSQFARHRTEKKADLKYTNVPHRFKVMTKQETALQLRDLVSLRRVGDTECDAEWDAEFRALYENVGQVSDDQPENFGKNPIGAIKNIA